MPLFRNDPTSDNAAIAAAQLATDVAAVTAAKANLKAGETIIGSEAGTYYGEPFVFGRVSGYDHEFYACHELHVDWDDYWTGSMHVMETIDILRFRLGEYNFITTENRVGPVGTFYIDEFGDYAEFHYTGAAWDCENLVINCTLADTCTLNLAGGNLSEASINGLMAALVASGSTAATVDVSGGTSAAPTGQGITDKATAISAGCSVTTN